MYVGSTCHTTLARGDEVVRANARLVEVLTLLVVIKKIGLKKTFQEKVLISGVENVYWIIWKLRI